MSTRAQTQVPLFLLLQGMMSHDRARIRDASQMIRHHLKSENVLVPRPESSSSDDTDEVDLITQFLAHDPSKASEQSGRDNSLPLHLAAHLGNLRLCEVICEAHPPAIKFPNKKGKIPLHFAAREGHVDIVRYFLNVNPKVASHASVKLKLPLHFSASEGHIEISRMLLQAFPAGARSLSSKGKLPLHFASRWGHHEIVKMLLQRYPHGARSLDWEGSLPLHDAALENYDEVVKSLIRVYPAGLKKSNIRGEVPLFAAVRNNNASMVYSMLRQFPRGGKIVLQNLNENDRINCLHWEVLELCLLCAAGFPLPPRGSYPDASSCAQDPYFRGFEERVLPDLIRNEGVGVHAMDSVPVNRNRTDVVLVNVQPWPSASNSCVGFQCNQPQHVVSTAQWSFCGGHDFSAAPSRCEISYPPSSLPSQGQSELKRRLDPSTSETDEKVPADKPDEHFPSHAAKRPRDEKSHHDSFIKCHESSDKTITTPQYYQSHQSYDSQHHSHCNHVNDYSMMNHWNRHTSSFLPLHASLECGASLPVLRSMLARCPDYVSVIDLYGRLPLHLAASSGQKGSRMTDFIKELLRLYPHGAKVRDNANRLPLHVALMHGAEFEVVRVLMDGNKSAAVDLCGTFDGYEYMLPLVMALGSDCDLDVVHCLVREDPTVVNLLQKRWI